MLKNVVVPIDGSEYSWSAVQHSIQIARPFRAKIHGVYAIDAKVIQGDLLDDLEVDPEVAKGVYMDKGENLLENFAGKCKAEGLVCQPIVDVSAIPDLIRKTAREIEADLIIMGKKGVNAQWTGPLLGSTAESMVRRAGRPVLLAQESYAPIERVLVAYDGELVSVRALRFAAEICERCKWGMSVISVHDSEQRRDRLLREAEEMAELHQLKITTIGRDGDVTEQIIDAASEHPNTLIAIGAYSSRLRRLILGSVSEEVMRRAAQPVLVYRPSS
jgi:nucleotide-binding universal stress UspA family protein